MAIFLRVLPNKTIAVDDEGNPTAAYPMEGMHDRLVGARVVVDEGREPTFGEMIATGARGPRRRVVFDDAGPVSVPCTAYYLYGLRHGDILPADEETAMHAGIKFVAPSQ